MDIGGRFRARYPYRPAVSVAAKFEPSMPSVLFS